MLCTNFTLYIVIFHACFPEELYQINCVDCFPRYIHIDGRQSDVLNQVELPIVSFQSCLQIYPTVINENRLCAGNLTSGGKDTCQGDSGGPLVSWSNKTFWLTGLTSIGGLICAAPGRPGIYTNVSMFYGWINTIMNGMRLHSYRLFVYLFCFTLSRHARIRDF